MKKRLLSFLLILVLLISALPLTASADSGGLYNFRKSRSYPAGKFSDVTSDKWFYDNVVCGYEYGLIDGRTESSYGPDLNVTLGEIVKLAACLRSIYYTGTTNFVQGAPWYDVYFEYLFDNDVLPEYFRDSVAYADEYVSRAFVAYIFWAALPYEALEYINYVEEFSIPDVPYWNEYYYPIYDLYRAGILAGKGEDGTFEPDEPVLRSEVATILSRIVDVSLRKYFTLVRTVYIVPSTDYILLGKGESETIIISVLDNTKDIFLDYYGNCITAKWGKDIDPFTYTIQIDAHSVGTDYLEVYQLDEYGDYGYIYIPIDVIP